ncbi:hypothetical protein [Mycobacterium sp. 1245805.9]|uniref:hypothetical protein n=1 Tax=Mycobacterium sp. 1245805.9 TaxID=1856862 RepID=UPI000800B756|nr:hypothetical protein [Mycobacterium sp. 1245805.9]OBI81786.1 hypothetical protein A9X00_08745 [Mycobacterium sp. 1245805.9]
MGSGESDLGRFLVEWYGPTAGAGPVGETAGRLNDGAATLSARGARIRLLAALAIPDDDYAFGVFAAESADTVTQLCADAGAPPDRVSPAFGWLRTPDG